ncbi:MFS transporter [Aerococcaceae bacterium zg-ZUI334]|uniref:MFS transporter n=1 Tax=Aerococcaceae bacterium zg-252 TaxID=2796928 RepID=UPI001B8F1A42|nr:MFS transporter [Aerococcaceae bacterium zg-ZUI334]MBS4462144.1 glycoside-pentoside-hexuronide (GPH):cation symporter [Aerococcaceae bacterium zg-B36]
MLKEKSVSSKVSLSEKVTFGFGNLAANLMITTANGFITYFYTDVVGLTIGVVGTILLFARVFDGVSDLVAGAVVDRTATATGKARPWIKRMILPYGLALILLFTSPAFLPEGMKAIYAFATYVISLAGVYTFTMVPYNTLIGTTTSDPKERGFLSTSRTIFGFVGAFAVNGAVLKIVESFGSVTDASSWTKMAAVFALLSIVLLTLLYSNSKERVLESSEALSADRAQKVSTSDNIKALLKNKYWVIMILSMLISFINAGLGGINIFYAQWILGDISKVALLGMLSFAPIIAGSFIVPIFMAKMSKRNVMLLGSFVILVGLIILALFPTDFTMICVGLIIRGLGTAPSAVAGFAMLGDIADYGEWKTGIRSDGLIFSAATFGEKVGSGLGGWILGIIMAMAGYVAKAPTQTAAALFSIKAIFAYIPIIFTVITIVLMFFYDLDNKMPEILKDIQSRLTGSDNA